MTISTTTSRVSYTANGSTDVFAYTFKIFSDSEIKVYVDNVLKTLTTHYTVSGAGESSGGNVTFTTGNTPANLEIVALARNIARTQATDYVENDSFPAETHEAALDKLTMLVQDVDNTVTGDIFRFSESVTDAGTVTITKTAAQRASKLLAFDTSGDLQATQEIGVYQGNWAASTAYAIRDLIKDTSNNNIYICNTAHTSSGSQPISSNADVAKWTLIIDAAAAATSATAAATSATAAATSATAAASSATAAASSATSAASSATSATSSASTATTQASAASTSAAAAAASYDNFDDRWLGDKASDPSVDNDGNSLLDGAAYFNTTNNVLMVYDLGGTTWNRTTPTSSDQTKINTVSGIQANVTTVAGISSNVTTVAGISSNVTTVAGISSDVTAVAADATDIGAVAAKATEIGRLGTADAVADMAILGTADVVTDMNTLGTADVVADMNTLGTADVVADMNTLGTADVVNDMNVLGTSGNVTNMNTLSGISANITSVAGIAANVTTVAGISANVTTVATNEASVNRYSDEYTISASAPVSPSEGDLWYDSSNNVLKVHNGSSFVAVTSATSGITDVVDDSTPQLGGDLDLNGNDIPASESVKGFSIAMAICL